MPFGVRKALPVLIRNIDNLKKYDSFDNASAEDARLQLHFNLRKAQVSTQKLKTHPNFSRKQKNVHAQMTYDTIKYTKKRVRLFAVADFWLRKKETFCFNFVRAKKKVSLFSK